MVLHRPIECTALIGTWQDDIDKCTQQRAQFRPLMRYQIDGARFSTLEEFFDEISRVLLPGWQWGHNLDAFNDILRGGFGTPSGGFTIDWKNHGLSQERLGYDETIRQLELQAENCHPQSRDKTLADLATARAHRGPTVIRLADSNHPHSWSRSFGSARWRRTDTRLVFDCATTPQKS